MANILLSMVGKHADKISLHIRKLCAAKKSDDKIASEVSLEKVESYLNVHPNVFGIYVIDGDSERIIKLLTLIRFVNKDAKIIIIGNADLDVLNKYLICQPSAIVSLERFNEEFNKILMTCLAQCAQTSNFFVIKTRDRALRIEYNKILYFSSDKRIVSVHLESGKTFAFYSKLSDVAKMLPNDTFIQCHQSFVVNSNKVVAINKSERILVLNGDEEIEISKAKYGEVLNHFCRYEIENK